VGLFLGISLCTYQGLIRAPSLLPKLARILTIMNLICAASLFVESANYVVYYYHTTMLLVLLPTFGANKLAGIFVYSCQSCGPFHIVHYSISEGSAFFKSIPRVVGACVSDFQDYAEYI